MLVEQVNARAVPGGYEESYLTDNNCIIFFNVDFMLNKVKLSVIDRNTGKYVKPADELVSAFTDRSKAIMKGCLS